MSNTPVPGNGSQEEVPPDDLSDNRDTVPPHPQVARIVWSYSKSILLGCLPFVAGFALYFLGGMADNIVVLSYGFMLCGMLSVAVVVRAKRVISCVIAAVMLMPLINAFSDVPAVGMLQMPFSFLAVGCALSAALNATNAVFARSRLAWIQPVLVMLIIVFCNPEALSRKQSLVVFASFMVASATRYYRERILLLK